MRAFAAEAEAAGLVRDSYAHYRRAEDATDGWREIYDEGARLAERAIGLDPRNAEARYALFLNLGRRAQRSGVGAQILIVRRLRTLLEEATTLDPRHAHAWEARGEMLARLPRLLGGSKSESEKAYRRATQLEPGWAKPWLRLAEARREDDPAEAAALAERGRRLACEVRPPAEICKEAKALATSLAPAAGPLVRKETPPNSTAPH